MKNAVWILPVVPLLGVSPFVINPHYEYSLFLGLGVVLLLAAFLGFVEVSRRL